MGSPHIAPEGSDTTSLAEQRRGTVLDSAADIAQREPQSSDNGTVPDSGADRAVAGEDVAERVREEMGLDNPAPFDAGADLGELVRATYGGRAKDAQEEDAQEEDAAPHERDDGDAERDGVDQEPHAHSGGACASPAEPRAQQKAGSASPASAASPAAP